MTILHTYQSSMVEGEADLAAYFLTLDPSHLATAQTRLQGLCSVIQAELEDPSIQETIIHSTLPVHVLQKRIADDNAICLDSTEYVASGGDLTRGKLIRVIANDQNPESAFVTKVTFVNPETLILSPVFYFDQGGSGGSPDPRG